MAAPSPSEAGVSSPNTNASQSPSLTMQRDSREQDQVQPKTPSNNNAPMGFQDTMYKVRKRNFRAQPFLLMNRSSQSDLFSCPSTFLNLFLSCDKLY